MVPRVYKVNGDGSRPRGGGIRVFFFFLSGFHHVRACFLYYFFFFFVFGWGDRGAFLLDYRDGVDASLLTNPRR